MHDIGEMRNDLSELIDRLSAEFKDWKAEEKRKEKEAKLVETEQNVAAEKKSSDQQAVNKVEEEYCTEKGDLLV